MNRKPPEDVLRQLRREVDFGCPYPDCGCPILSWHHFEPPWNEENHHRPEGMIALCPEHHGLADGNNFTRAQLRSWKKAPNNREAVKYKIPWLWDNFVYEIGTSFWAPDAAINLNGATILQAQKGAEDSSPWELSMTLLNEHGQALAKIDNNYLNAPVNLEDISITYQGKKLEIIDKRGENFLSLSCRTIKRDSIKVYLEGIYKRAYKDSKIKHPDGRIEVEAKNTEKMNTLIENLYAILCEHLTSDDELRILDLDGKTGTKNFTLNHTRAEQHYNTQVAVIRSQLNWGFCKGSNTRI